MTSTPGSLTDVLSGVLAALTADPAGQAAALGVPRCNRAVVVLVDGMGAELVADRAAYAPYVASLLEDGRRLRCTFPSTTATSLATFGTGLPPGAHGMLGYQVLNPQTGALFNELSWENGPDPLTWQPNQTVFQRAEAAGVKTFQIGPSFFEGSGLTTAALRGPAFVSAWSLDDRVDAAMRVVRSAPRTLVYLYWGEVDKIGHALGCGSNAWIEELQAFDLALRQLVTRVPADTAVVVTADHGMIDVPPHRRLDLADDTPLSRHLRDGVRLTGGEPRAPMLYCEPGQADAVLQRWRETVGEDFDVVSRDEALAAGWFGDVRAEVVERIGDVMLSGSSDASIHDTRFQRVEQLNLVGYHGARTDVESSIPLLVVPPRVAVA